MRERANFLKAAYLFSSFVGCFFSSFFGFVSSVGSFVSGFFCYVGSFFSGFSRHVSFDGFNRRLNSVSGTSEKGCSSSACKEFFHKSFPS